MKTQEVQKSTYKIGGEFLGFIPKPGGELKYIQVQVGERIIPVKLAKELRETLGATLLKGDRLSIVLQQKDLGDINKIKLKTNCVEKLNSANESLIFESISSNLANNQKGTILLCHKSSCAKRGGNKLYHTLTATLKQLGLQKRVKIELTGCQKQCKKAPSLILMPGKVKHTYVNPNDLSSLLEAHYL